MKSMKILLLGLCVAVSNGKYGSLWIDDEEDNVCLQTSAPFADDILLLDNRVKAIKQ
jgi:hypothetical protein